MKKLLAEIKKLKQRMPAQIERVVIDKGMKLGEGRFEILEYIDRVAQLRDKK